MVLLGVVGEGEQEVVDVPLCDEHADMNNEPRSPVGIRARLVTGIVDTEWGARQEPDLAFLLASFYFIFLFGSFHLDLSFSVSFGWYMPGCIQHLFSGVFLGGGGREGERTGSGAHLRLVGYICWTGRFDTIHRHNSHFSSCLFVPGLALAYFFS